MKTKYFSILFVLVITQFIFSFITKEAVSRPADQREILVYIKPPYISFPDSTSMSLDVSQVQLYSTSLSNVFSAFKVDTIARAFPDFYQNDTLIKDSQGNALGLMFFSRIYKITVNSADDVDPLIDTLNKMTDVVVYAESNYMDFQIGSNSTLSIDPNYGEQWYLKNNGGSYGTPGADIKIEPVWGRGITGGSTFKVGLVDSGVDTDHRDLNGRVTGDKYSGEINDISGKTRHGTMMAGLISAIGNTYDIKGVSNTPIISYRIFVNSGIITVNGVVDKIIDASNTCAVLNCSFYTGSYAMNGDNGRTYKYAIKYATTKNVVIVACMGNEEGTSIPNYPAAYDGVIAVGALDHNNLKPSYANWGGHIDLSAPGGVDEDYNRILSTSITDGGTTTAYGNGTSQATALVTGVVSLMLNTRSLTNPMNRDDVEEILQMSAFDLGAPGWDETFGSGRLDADLALKYCKTPYVIHHPAAESPNNYVAVSTDYDYVKITGFPNLNDDKYRKVTKKQVHHNISFNIPVGHSFIHSSTVRGVWGRSISDDPNNRNPITGYGNDIQTSGINSYLAPGIFCEIDGPVTVTGSTVNTVLKTYVYEVYDGNFNLIGTYPTTPSNVTNWRYSFLTKNNRIKNAEQVFDNNQQIIFEPNADYTYTLNNEFNDFNVRDSSKIILLDSAVLELPDNFTLNVSGKTSSLILKPHSKILCGENSKIVIDSNATFIANGATFESLDSTKKWKGLILKNADSVNINNCTIKNVNAENNSGYAINLINTKIINIDSCYINNMNSSAGGIQIYYVSNLLMDPEINITNNTIKISTDTCDGISITPYSWLTMTGYISGNKIINTSSGGGRYGIYGFDLVGTPIKNNYIENFSNGILTWYSSLDLFENTIDTKNISNGWDLYGIVSEYNLSNAYESRLGGSNMLTTLNGRNICLDALDININEGNNIFNINDSSGYHMAGYYPKSNMEKQDANNNCFKIEGVPVGDEYGIRKYVTELDGTTPVVYNFGTFNCSPDPNYCNFYLGGNASDTVWIECAGGMGGGQKEGASVTSEDNVYLQTYDSLSINMRKKQYDLAAEKCMTLLDDYTDSTKTINAVDKLYRTALATNKVSELKSYYESFILSHPNHTQIIQRMFYYIQKAKAALGQYESAMTGFQTIMTEFPSSFEGLAAKWDYMATQLLSNSGGQGGSEKETINYEMLTDEQRHERLVSLVEDPLDKYDKKKFSKEDRKVIVTNIVNSFEGNKTKEANRYKELESKMNMGKANANEKQEYNTKTVLKEIVRTKKVNTISEHISTVQTDIKKIFKIEKSTDDSYTKMANSIPGEYKLNQNYPNPFNPSTKINYELKNNGFVSLKIYDLLGREIAELVNMNQDAGRYAVDFNAAKYMMASGIYFYRIKAGEFVDTKRMVLVK